MYEGVNVGKNTGKKRRSEELDNRGSGVFVCREQTG